MRLVLLSSLLLTLLAGCRPAPEEGAFEGPGWSEEEGFLVEADQLLVGLTYLQVRNAPEPGNQASRSYFFAAALLSAPEQMLMTRYGMPRDL